MRHSTAIISDDPTLRRIVDRIVEAIHPQREFSMDVFVLSPEEFDEQKDIANTLGYIVARDGEVLYERA